MIIKPKNKKDLLRLLGNSMDYHHVSTELKAMITYILYDTDYDPLNDYDGCTGVSDDTPNINLACWVHDYMFIKGFNLMKSNRVMLLINIECHRNPLVRNWRFIGVSIASLWFKIRNIFKYKKLKSNEILMYLKSI